MIIKLTQETLKELARFEKRFSDIVPRNDWDKYYAGEIELQTESKYAVKVDDIKAAFENLGKVDMNADDLCDMIHEEWVLLEEAITDDSYETAEEDIELPKGLWNATEVAQDEIFCIEDRIFSDNWPNKSICNIEQAMKYIGKPFDQREYSHGCKKFFINMHFETEFKFMAEEAVPLWKSTVEEFCKENDEDALRAKAYSCYGGNVAYECDWVTSRDCLLKLMEISEDPFYANTLGYIYYYGRCTDGEPEYDKAFKYFSIGAAGGVYESRYKLADMFRHGYYINKNMKIAKSIVSELYYENREYMLNGNFESKFADVALRMGKLALEDKRYEKAFEYLLEAEYAIKQREGFNHYGDGKVAKGIAEELEKARELSGHSEIVKTQTIRPYLIAEYLRPYLNQGYLARMKYKRLKNGGYSLKFSLLPIFRMDYAPDIWITNTKAAFSGHVKHIAAKIAPENNTDWGESGEIIFNYMMPDGELYLNWDKVGEVPDGMKVKFAKK